MFKRLVYYTTKSVVFQQYMLTYIYTSAIIVAKETVAGATIAVKEVFYVEIYENA